MVSEDLARDSTVSAGATNSGITVPHQVQRPRQLSAAADGPCTIGHPIDRATVATALSYLASLGALQPQGALSRHDADLLDEAPTTANEPASPSHWDGHRP